MNLVDNHNFLFFKNFFSNIVVVLGIISIIGVIVRIIFVEFEAPLTLDSTGYFWYAIDTSVSGKFPTIDCGWRCTFPNTGWSTFLSILFTIFHSENYIDYMNIQRFSSVIFSVITVFPIFFLCNNFFPKRYALIGTIFFVFNPRIIENSIMGITDSMYIFFFTMMILTFFKYGKKYPFLSFGLIGLLSIVRFEGLILFVPISILYFYKFRVNKRTLKKYFFAVLIFLMILIPWGMMKNEISGSDGLLSNVLGGPIYYDSVVKENNGSEEVMRSFISTGLNYTFRYLILSTLPLLTFLVPLGIYIMISKKEYSNFLILLLISITLCIPAFYAYSRSFQETRYLLPLIPIFCLISCYYIRNITDKIQYKKLFLVSISIFIIFSSIIFIQFKNSDDVNQVEAYKITQKISEMTNVITYYSQSGHLDNMRILKSEEFPILRKNLPPPFTMLYPDNYNSLEQYIIENREDGLEYIIVDKGDWRSKFLDDLFLNEEKYPYLTKVFDSLESGYKNYHVKIFKINFKDLVNFQDNLD